VNSAISLKTIASRSYLENRESIETLTRSTRGESPINLARSAAPITRTRGGRGARANRRAVSDPAGSRERERERERERGALDRASRKAAASIDRRVATCARMEDEYARVYRVTPAI